MNLISGWWIWSSVLSVLPSSLDIGSPKVSCWFWTADWSNPKELQETQECPPCLISGWVFELYCVEITSYTLNCKSEQVPERIINVPLCMYWPTLCECRLCYLASVFHDIISFCVLRTASNNAHHQHRGTFALFSAKQMSCSFHR